MDGRRHFRPSRSASGAVSLEFILLAPIVFLFVLGIFQVIHGFATRVVLEYATYRGARAAAVWLQEAETEGVSQAEAQRSVEAAVALAMTPVSPPQARQSGKGAAAQPYARVASAVGGGGDAPYEGFDGWNAHRAFDAETDVRRRGLGKAAYAFQGIKVTLNREGNRAKVDVEYAFFCAWPLANMFYGVGVDKLPGWWQGRLSQAGVTPVARVRIMKSSASHFISKRPAG